MQPSDPDDSTKNTSIPPAPNAAPPRPPEQDAAVQLMRQQIDTIYNETPSEKQHSNPYQQTHTEQGDHVASQAAPHSDWKQYHSAWQSYYQQYYERYYIAQLHRRQQAIKPSGSPSQFQPLTESVASSNELDRDQAVNELRTKLLTEVKTRSQKVRKSRHFMPLVAAITVAVVFGLLQYNRLLVAQVKAYVSPGSINPQNIILDPTTSTAVSAEPKIIIPKINVDAPVVYDVPSIEESVVQDKLRSGVVHYPIPGASSVPGQTGNTVILGHSSNDVFDDGAYKFVFVQLDKLAIGDTFYLNYQGTRYTYSVTEKKVISPNEVSQLIIDNGKPLATLVTCTPPGTALKRLVVIAEQISPDPDKAATHSETTSTKPTNIAGNSPTLLERLFGN